MNIGIVGHVDHGKTSLVKALSGEWADKHSEEIKRGITIRLGYADVDIYECQECKADRYSVSETCGKGHKAKFLRKVSFVDCPGHENLMAVMLSGAALMDAAILVIAANEECPKPQTQEHLSAIEVAGIKDIVIVQNKVDLVSKEKALENYRQIQGFVKGTVAEKAPIIPVSANYGVNINAVIEAMQAQLPTPKRDGKAPLKAFVARSFDVNKPNSEIGALIGGIIGGTIVEGELKVGDEIELRPGTLTEKGEYAPCTTKVTSLSTSKGKIKKADAGGLIGIGTLLDPSLTKGDKLVGNIVGTPGKLPEIRHNLDVELHFLDRIVDKNDKDIKEGEQLVINSGTSTGVGVVSKRRGSMLSIELKRPLCVEVGNKIAISQRFKSRWSLTGYGVIK